MRHLVNRHLWQQFWGIALPYWRQEEKWKATGLIVLLVALLLGQTGFAVLFNEQTGEFTSALAAHDSERFWRAIRWCLALVAGPCRSTRSTTLCATPWATTGAAG